MENDTNETPEVTYINRNGIEISDINILTELCDEAGSASIDIRNCLKSYSLNTATKQLKCTFNQFKKPIIVETLQFLNALDRNWDNYKKEACVHELICRIQNLLIDKCQFCDHYYATPRNEVPLLQCSLCGQSVHNECLKKLLGDKYLETMTTSEVEKLVNPFNISSLKFMCVQCSCATLPQSSDGLKKSIAKKSTTHDCEVVATTEVPIIKDGDINNTIYPPPPQHSRKLPEVSSEDCQRYLIGQCPHGISGKTEVRGERCKFTHRKRCRKFCNFGTRSGLGCKKGKSCQYFHPILCKYSVQRGLCTNLECKFTHLKHTQRFEKNPNYNSSHYYNQNIGDYNTRDRDHQINNPQYAYNTHRNANYNDHNYTSFSHSARADVYPRDRFQVYRDPTQVTSNHASSRNKNTVNDLYSNNAIFSFLEQQVQMLKQDLNSQIGNLKNCLLANNTDTNPEELFKNPTNHAQQQHHLSLQNPSVQYTDKNAVNPYLTVQSQHQDPQLLQNAHLQNQWHPSQSIPFQNNSQTY